MSDSTEFDADDARLRELEQKVNRGEDLSADEEAELEGIIARFSDQTQGSIGEIKARAAEKADNLHAEYDVKLRELEEKAGKVKARESVRVRSKDELRKSDAESARGLGVGLSIAYTILGMPLVGLGIGWLLDNRYQSTAFKGIGTVSGAVLGIMVAFWMMNRPDSKS